MLRLRRVPSQIESLAMSLGVWKPSRKRIRFRVDFHLEELTCVPFIAGVIIAKLRLLSGGTFHQLSNREEIVDHRVQWNSHFEFEVKLGATLTTGFLDACHCRVSIRKEGKCGKTYHKLGFVDINLAEFAGGSPQSRCYLLNEYSSRSPANNALVRVTISMRVTDSDLCFKVPTSCLPSYFTDTIKMLEDTDTVPEPSTSTKENVREHSRQSSSSGSGIGDFTVSENGSLEGNFGRNSSGTTIIFDRYKRTSSSRIDATRVNPEDIIDQLLKDSDLGVSSMEEGGALSLFIGKDGKASVVSE